MNGPAWPDVGVIRSWHFFCIPLGSRFSPSGFFLFGFVCTAISTVRLLSDRKLLRAYVFGRFSVIAGTRRCLPLLPAVPPAKSAELTSFAQYGAPQHAFKKALMINGSLCVCVQKTNVMSKYVLNRLAMFRQETAWHR